MNKKEANLLYLSSKDGLDSKILWTKCQNHSETVTILKTDQDSVIGFYCPDKWEETTGKEDSAGIGDFKDIIGGKPFLFYFLDKKIEIIKHRDD